MRAHIRITAAIAGALTAICAGPSAAQAATRAPTITGNGAYVAAPKIVSFGSQITIRSKTGAVESPAAIPHAYYGLHDFTPQSPGWSVSDTNGSLNMQITYSSLVNAWSFNLSPYDQSLVYGGTVTYTFCRSYKNTAPTNYTFTHTPEPAAYLWHSSITKLSIGAQYQLSCTWKWPVAGNGTATLNWWANYILTLV